MLRMDSDSEHSETERRSDDEDHKNKMSADEELRALDFEMTVR